MNDWVELKVESWETGNLHYDYSWNFVDLPEIIRNRSDLDKINCSSQYTNIDFDLYDLIYTNANISEYSKIIEINPRYFMNFDANEFYVSTGITTKKSDRSISHYGPMIVCKVPNLPTGFKRAESM